MSLFSELGMHVALVGNTPGYEPFGVEILSDEVADAGPLSGVISLLRRANDQTAVAVACDMPHVTPALLQTLLRFPAGAPIVSPFADGRFETMFARYDAKRVLALALSQLEQQRYSLQELFRQAKAAPLSLSKDELWQLRDWDFPSDIERDRT